MTNNNKIIIATGGTGGHIFPSLSLANFLKDEYNLKITTDKRGLNYIKNSENFDIKIINSSTIFNKNIFKTFVGITKVIFSIFFSMFLLMKFRPKTVIGMGGYSSFPVCLAAYILRIPFIIYENNLVIGRANKFLLPLANKILVSTNKTSGIKTKFNHKVFQIGYLIRSHILNLKINKNQVIDKKQLSILITGGSQSAKIFGEILPNIIVQCSKNDIKFKIYQQCLDDQLNFIKNLYKKSNIQFELFSFTDDMSKYYLDADLAITRSGASSLSELINLRIPSIAIPLPTSADNHQLENANYFHKKGYCIVLEERFVKDKLFEILENLNKDRQKILLMKDKMTDHSDKDVFSKIKKLIIQI